MPHYQVKHGKIHDGLGKVYRPGDIVECQPHVVANLLSQVELISDAPSEKDGIGITNETTAPGTSDTPSFEIRKRPGLAPNQPAFDVIDLSTDEPVNPEPLFKAAAADLLKEKIGG